MKYYIYILFSASKDKFYVGASEDINKRLVRHNAGATPSTKSGRPWKIVYSEEYDNKSDAICRELKIKKMKSRKYIEQLIVNGNSAG